MLICQTAQAVEILRRINKELLILVAGGINEENGADYAATGIDGIVTTQSASAKRSTSVSAWYRGIESWIPIRLLGTKNDVAGYRGEHPRDMTALKSLC